MTIPVPGVVFSLSAWELPVPVKCSKEEGWLLALL